MSDRLDGARILVTRPAAQQRDLIAAIAALGGTALSLPLMDIEPAADAARLQRQLQSAASRCDWWLFTSRNAADAACRLLPPPWSLRVGAVGEGTASVLRAAGVDEVLVPQDRYSAAALLALPVFAQLAGQHIGIITGEQGREEAAELLRQRGAEVETLALYRRVPVVHAPAQLAALIAQAHAVVLSSAGGLEQLLAITPESARAQLLTLQLVVPAPRVVELARSRGFVAPALLPDQVTDAAYARVLARWWNRSPRS